MKNSAFETRRSYKWKPLTSRPVVVTRARLVRAFSVPGMSRQEVVSVVERYVGNSVVPPAWDRMGVRGIFGRKIERLWARHIRGLRRATYRDKQTGRFLTPVVQTAYDFCSTPEQMKMISITPPSAPAAHDKPLVFLDEFGAYATAKVSQCQA